MSFGGAQFFFPLIGVLYEVYTFWTKFVSVTDYMTGILINA